MSIDREQIAALGAMPQPDPTPGTGDVWREVIESGLLSPELIALAEARRRMGIERYGRPLQRGNGRDHLADALQEGLDLLVYLCAARWTNERLAYFVRGIEQIVAEIKMRGEP